MYISKKEIRRQIAVGQLSDGQIKPTPYSATAYSTSMKWKSVSKFEISDELNVYKPIKKKL